MEQFSLNMACVFFLDGEYGDFQSGIDKIDVLPGRISETPLGIEDTPSWYWGVNQKKGWYLAL